MTKRMLIDATHPEETRVAVVTGSRLDEYDFETVVRKQLKGNIYLVKVTRVEPSLQAAFVDFGGNRHGFLPFPEIHPDYYRIPIADREALLAEERQLAAEQAAREDEEDAAELAAQGQSLEDFDDEEDDQAEDEANAGADEYVPKHTGSIAEEIARDGVTSEPEEDNDEEDATEASSEEQPAPQETPAADAAAADAPAAGGEAVSESSESPSAEKDDVETVGGDAVEQTVYRSAIKRRYKIQEVIKRNQIMLIQIGKEERGNKGAAVTSYISLPGRYCVLMPNSPRGGGVSRKVSNAKDRQRLKKILVELNVPEGMSVILRTAGVSRSKAEIKRDLDYLLRLWDQIRELTLKSTAPALIYEEGNLIKRAIRDLYRREIDEVHVAGEEAYKTAHDFMRTLMPSHASRIQHYTDNSMPLFFRYQVESQIDEIHSPTVHLKSGGYIVINPTEAMVSIDVNSGKATKGRHIEETALKTNLEAADEVARQLRLRDQGGLIVIDFIDMEDKRNNRIVERRLRDAMQHDRARIQLGRISAFGLLELSRQRLHPSLVETNFETCKHCNGAGLVRTVETTGVMILRALEEECMRAKSSEIRITAPAPIALYLFNHKREMLSVLEKRYNVKMSVSVDDTLVKPNFQIEAVKALVSRDDQQRSRRPAPVQTVDMSDLPDIPEDQITDDSTVADDSRFEDEGGDAGDRGDAGRGGGRHHHGGGGGGGGRDRDRGGFGGDDGGRRRGRRGGKRRGGRHRDGDRNFNDRGGGGGGRPHHQGGGHHQGSEGGGDPFPHDAEQPVFAGASDPQGEGFQPSDGGQPAEGGHHSGQGGGHHGGERGDRHRGGRRRGGRGRGRDRNRGGDRHGGQRHGQHGGGHHQGGGEGGQPSGDTGGGNESFNPAPQGGNDSPPPRREYSAPQESSSMPEAANEGGGEGDGKNRKGWWKRLTE